MLTVRRIAVIRPAFALATSAALVASAGAAANDPDKGIVFDSAYETRSAESLSGLLAMKLANLAEIDPDHPLASNRATQTLSMFGREDLIASSSKNFAQR
jgi:hypothetical protein